MPTLLLGFPQSRKGAGDDPLLMDLRPLLEAGGVSVLTLKLTIGADDAVLVREMEAAIDQCEQSKLIIGGFSLGARIALRVAARVRPAALLCLGFPFHPPGQPQGHDRGLRPFCRPRHTNAHRSRRSRSPRNPARNKNRLPAPARLRAIAMD